MLDNTIYTASQVRNMQYEPKSSDKSLEAVIQRIVIAQIKGVSRSCNVNVSEEEFNDLAPKLKNLGYNTEKLDFLGNKYLHVSW